MAKGKNGSSGSDPYSDTTSYDRGDTTPGNRNGTTTPDKDGYSIGKFTIEPHHRATGVSAEEAVKKTYGRDD
jgi:hypothetical protein